jgi:putative ABC transport system permease protein
VNRTFWRILRGSLLQRRGRVGLAMLAIAIGTSVAAALLLVSRDVGAKVEKELRAYGPNAMLAPSSGSLAVGARDAQLGDVAQQAAFGAETRRWLEGQHVTFATLRYGAASRAGRTFALAASDPGQILKLYPSWRASPGEGALVGEDLAAKLHVKAGDDVTIDVARGASSQAITLKGVRILESGGGEDELIVAAPRDLPGDPDAFQLALIRVPGAARAVVAWTSQQVPQGELRAIKQLSAADGEVLKRLSRLLATVTAVALLAALLCAMSTLADLVLERTREVALLRSLGAGKRDVLALFASEAIVIGLVGGTIGLAIGIVAAQAIGHGVFGTSIALAPVALPVTLGLGVATALLASLFPVRHALEIEPATILRGE